MGHGHWLNEQKAFSLFFVDDPKLRTKMRSNKMTKIGLNQIKLTRDKYKVCALGSVNLLRKYRMRICGRKATHGAFQLGSSSI